MAGTASDLDSLIRLRDWEVDERRRELGVLMTREGDMIMFGQELDRQLIREGQQYSQNPVEGGRWFGAFLVDHKKRREQLAVALENLRREIEVARESLSDAYRVRRTIEEVRKKRADREAIEAARKEQFELDEIAQNQYQRRAK